MIRALIKKEFLQFRRSSHLFFIFGLFQLIISVIFINLISDYQLSWQNQTDNLGELSFINSVILKLMANVNFLLLFFIPILTAKSYADEKNLGTYELLLNSKLKPFKIILAKLFSFWGIHLFLVMISLLIPLVFFSFKVKDLGILLSGMIGLSLNIAAFVGIGTTASLLTRNTTSSALLTFSFLLFFWIITWMSKMTDQFIVVEILNYISMMIHFENIIKGLISLSDFFYYFTFINMAILIQFSILRMSRWFK
jgi:ABC-2 type transport system permease protein